MEFPHVKTKYATWDYELNLNWSTTTTFFLMWSRNKSQFVNMWTELFTHVNPNFNMLTCKISSGHFENGFVLNECEIRGFHFHYIFHFHSDFHSFSHVGNKEMSHVNWFVFFRSLLIHIPTCKLHTVICDWLFSTCGNIRSCPLQFVSHHLSNSVQS